jgi:hypothetical protein
MIGGRHRRALTLGLFIAGLLAADARAHELNPALLDVHERPDGTAEVLWKVPSVGGEPADLLPVLPATCRNVTEPAPVPIALGLAAQWIVRCDGGLDGLELRIGGAELPNDVLVRVTRADGSKEQSVLRQGDDRVVRFGRSAGGVGRYLGLGVEHILGGFDHLLFVLALFLLTRPRGAAASAVRPLVLTITAFTVAHSVTLSLSVLDLVRLDSGAVEASIALSILLLAVELARDPTARPTWTQRRPWAIAFAFGLLHGFGFAGALREVGLPPAEAPLGLLLFNVGVELGQLVFVAGLVGLTVLQRLPWAARLRPALRTFAAYGVGSLAAFWCIERVASFVP